MGWINFAPIALDWLSVVARFAASRISALPRLSPTTVSGPLSSPAQVLGSLVGAALAAGMSWRQIEQMAQSIFWPRLLHGRTLEGFCSKYLPRTFSELEIPFIAIATELPARRVLAIAEGNLASATQRQLRHAGRAKGGEQGREAA